MAPTRPNLLVLVRHGQSERNFARKGNTFFPDDESRQALRGEADHRTPLTELGCQQARDAGLQIREQFGTFDYVYHSGYRRTAQTTELILEAYSADERQAIEVRHNLFLREREPGFAFDMTTAEANAAFPWLQEYWDTSGRFFARPPGGESLADVAQRVYLFLGMLFRDRADAKVLVVSHGGTTRMFRYLLERWTYDDVVDRWSSEPIKNCGVVTYRFDPAVGRLVLADEPVLDPDQE
ncbi:MAG: histidine phosphatase family protein [Acidobacteriota bacterium]|nr:histidine phosphatase family protein [Acidobacteriota bacterium]